jgi:hypothetical protein
MLVERTADPSTSLRSGPTARRGRRDDKGEGSASVRIGCWLRELQIPPLRFTPVPRHAGAGGMTKGRAVLRCESDAG